MLIFLRDWWVFPSPITNDSFSDIFYHLTVHDRAYHIAGEFGRGKV